MCRPIYLIASPERCGVTENTESVASIEHPTADYVLAAPEIGEYPQSQCDQGRDQARRSTIVEIVLISSAPLNGFCKQAGILSLAIGGAA